MMEFLRTQQNQDGGWPYRSGGSSWIEPTVFVLLAGYVAGDNSGRERGLSWLRSNQRSDGGWSPKPGVDQSTWVTALPALLPPVDLGVPTHARAIRFLLDLTAANATLTYRIQSWLRGERGVSDPNQGWPWFPGTAAWATPTALSIIALAKQNRRNPDPVLKERIAGGQGFLLAHRCVDGGWNHGSINALGVDAASYPETTGTGLLAIAASGANRDVLQKSITRAGAWWKDCPSCEAASWLQLGLRAAGRPAPVNTTQWKPRTIQDAALLALAAAGDRGTEIFLA